MRPIRAQAADTATAETATPNAHSNAGPFMLTLCRLNVPVTIRPPQTQHLRRFTFFTSRSRQQDGTERLYLHVGYFATLVEAQRSLQLLRGRYPQAIATSVPTALLSRPESCIPVLQPAVPSRGAPEAAERTLDDTLTDTQVIRVLETRRVTPIPENTGDANCEQVALLRPDDTNTRRALKEAVVQGAPVFFAVQLQWSVEPIVPARVQSLSIFKAYTLYVAESRRERRACHFLRLGFFKDAISAKQVAYYVRSSFASAAVVPVTEHERTTASETCIDLSVLADRKPEAGPPAHVESRQNLDRDRSATSRLPQSNPPTVPLKKPNAPAIGSQTVNKRRSETLEQTLEMLAESEMWTDSDSPSETGVRHLQVTRAR